MARDKIFSTRMDESIIHCINSMAKNLRVSKKALIERAILHFANTQKEISQTDPFDETCGSWLRPTDPAKDISNIRKSFNESMKRHHR